ncbi:uncharacterized protein LOC110711144 [Chenopodium quinoa]|uniref:uncharacterized protein LOC110711144 n=1 Tax=Chenopodium quinoa TaxID=63459 RepID=UPI000B76C21F|nr:uncharacterized protein LOC110711144 [Chenopodium quinoa]
MAANKKPSFNVEINHSMLRTLPIPNKVNKLVRGFPIFKVQRGEDTKVYSIYLLYISYGHRVETHFGKGWENFVEENDIQLEDMLEITCEGNRCFHVAVFRGGIEIPTAAINSNIIVLSDGSSSDGDGPDEVEGQPEFRATFTQPYINVGRLNVPLDFARSHLDSLGPETPVFAWMNKKYPSCLYVKRNSRDQIRLCNIRNGITDMIRGKKIKKGDKVVVQMISISPPAFKVSFA